MKNKIIALLSLISFGMAAAPSNSQAGLLIGALAGDAKTGAIVGGSIGGAWFIAGTVTKDGPFTNSVDGFELFFYSVFFIAPAVAVTLLDVNATLSEDELVCSLKRELPFIDNGEVIQEVAARTKQKAAEQIKSDPSAKQIMVSFSKTEIYEMISSADLSDEQIQQVVGLLN